MRPIAVSGGDRGACGVDAIEVFCLPAQQPVKDANTQRGRVEVLARPLHTRLCSLALDRGTRARTDDARRTAVEVATAVVADAVVIAPHQACDHGRHAGWV